MKLDPVVESRKVVWCNACLCYHEIGQGHHIGR